MNLSVFEFVEAPLVRRALTIRGDLRSEVAFQNDIDALVSLMDHIPVPFRSVAGLTRYSVGWLERGVTRADRDLPSSICLGRTSIEWAA